LIINFVGLKDGFLWDMYKKKRARSFVGRKERNFPTFSDTYCTSGSRHAVTGIICPVPKV